MKTIIGILISSIALSSSLLCSDKEAHKEQARKILNLSIKTAEDMERLLQTFAQQIVSDASTSLSNNELVKIARNELESNEDFYVNLISSAIGEKDMADAVKLVESPLFIKFRDLLLFPVNYQCAHHLQEKMTDQALEHPQGSTEIAKQEKALIELTKENYNTVLVNSPFLIVDVYADWCGPCKLLAPVIKSLSRDYGHLYSFAKLNASPENEELIRSLGVQSLPTVIFYKEGKEVGRSLGFTYEKTLLKMAQEHFSVVRSTAVETES